MAIGIALWGDRPIGWRFMSTVFGALTLVGMFLWSFALFRNEQIALWTAAITFLNQILYVQARIGMLDTFMVAFIVFGLAAFSAAWDPDLKPLWTRRLFMMTGIFLGLATTTKWFGVIPWALCVALVFLIRVLQYWGTRFEKPSSGDWYHPNLWKQISDRDFVFYLLILPLLVYYIPFWPTLIQNESPHSLWDVLFPMQARMWDGQSRVVGTHPYLSTWTQWAIMKRPIWYAFDHEGENDQLVRGVLLLGNPLIMWGGLLALLGCVYGWIKKRQREAMLIVVIYGALYFSWAVIPRKVAFYYYYYPAGMVLSLALAYVFHQFESILGKKLRVGFLVLALGLFAYFYPILAALKIPASSFTRYMWLESWI